VRPFASRRWRLPAAEQLLGRPVYVALACALVLIVAGSIAAPAPALALPSPADLLPSSLPSLDPSQWVVDGFKAILTFIFGDQLDELGSHLVNLLLAVPLLTDNGAFPRLNNYREYVTGGAWGILALSFVVASLRYWLSSYSGSGAYEALTGFVRSAGAIGLLLIFPIAFDQVSRAVNAFTAALVVNPSAGGLRGTSSCSSRCWLVTRLPVVITAPPATPATYHERDSRRNGA
jgi:hypothetical protein